MVVINNFLFVLFCDGYKASQGLWSFSISTVAVYLTFLLGCRTMSGWFYYIVSLSSKIIHCMIMSSCAPCGYDPALSF